MSINIARVDMSDLLDEIEDMGRSAETFPMSLIAMRLVDAVEEEIASGGRGGWDPLSDSTLRRHPGRSNSRILRDSGRLSAIVGDDGPDWADAGSPVGYATFHLEGTRHMPKRDFLDIDLDAEMDTSLDMILEEAVMA